jgi:hypothetical protein
MVPAKLGGGTKESSIKVQGGASGVQSPVANFLFLSSIPLSYSSSGSLASGLSGSANV